MNFHPLVRLGFYAATVYPLSIFLFAPWIAPPDSNPAYMWGLALFFWFALILFLGGLEENCSEEKNFAVPLAGVILGSIFSVISLSSASTPEERHQEDVARWTSEAAAVVETAEGKPPRTEIRSPRVHVSEADVLISQAAVQWSEGDLEGAIRSAESAKQIYGQDPEADQGKLQSLNGMIRDARNQIATASRKTDMSERSRESELRQAGHYEAEGMAAIQAKRYLSGLNDLGLARELYKQHLPPSDPRIVRLNDLIWEVESALH